MKNHKLKILIIIFGILLIIGVIITYIHFDKSDNTKNENMDIKNIENTAPTNENAENESKVTGLEKKDLISAKVDDKLFLVQSIKTQDEKDITYLLVEDLKSTVKEEIYSYWLSPDYEHKIYVYKKQGGYDIIIILAAGRGEFEFDQLVIASFEENKISIKSNQVAHYLVYYDEEKYGFFSSGISLNDIDHKIIMPERNSVNYSYFPITYEISYNGKFEIMNTYSQEFKLKFKKIVISEIEKLRKLNINNKDIDFNSYYNTKTKELENCIK